MGLTKGKVAVGWFFLITILLLASDNSYGAWQGPAEIVSGLWGTGDKEFGMESGDTSEQLPSLTAIFPDGRLIISDGVNEREIVYNNDGTLVKVVNWYVNKDGVKTVNPEYPMYKYWDVQGYMPSGNIWIMTDKYFLKSPTGQIITTSTERPLDLGIVDQYGVGRTYKIKVTYPDNVYQITSDQPLTRYYRDLNKYLYQIVKYVTKDKIVSYRVHKYTLCGKEISVLNLPISQYEPMPPEAHDMPTWMRVPVVEYGEPLVAGNGDVYAGARTQAQYKILKWTWVDDPNVPTGPEPPTNLSLTPSINGLYLTWKASPNDPGCVTKYEVARATTSGGLFSTIDSVDKGALKYNDTTAEVGTTYYYKVRAMAGSDPSAYTAEASGKR